MLQSGRDTQQEARKMIATAGLRPTRQRIAVASLLIASEHGRVTAEIVYHEARDVGCGVSRATVCNTLRAFAQSACSDEFLTRSRGRFGLLPTSGRSARCV